MSKISGFKNAFEQPHSQKEIIDEHLFVEALAICALYKGDNMDNENEQ